MLQAVGIEFDSVSSNIDEAKIVRELNNNSLPEEVARELASAKACSVSLEHTDCLVIGADQILTFQDSIFFKPKDHIEALEKLKILRGNTHTLISAVCVAQAGKSLWHYVDLAHLTMLNHSDTFLETYLDKINDVATSCIGSYQIEGLGAWLFSDVEGDHFTVMGMPLLPLLHYLHNVHGVSL